MKKIKVLLIVALAFIAVGCSSKEKTTKCEVVMNTEGFNVDMAMDILSKGDKIKEIDLSFELKYDDFGLADQDQAKTFEKEIEKSMQESLKVDGLSVKAEKDAYLFEVSMNEKELKEVTKEESSSSLFPTNLSLKQTVKEIKAEDGTCK